VEKSGSISLSVLASMLENPISLIKGNHCDGFTQRFMAKQLSQDKYKRGEFIFILI
jgi:hypothetical protein